jgi:hypothetical protein
LRGKSIGQDSHVFWADREGRAPDRITMCSGLIEREKHRTGYPPALVGCITVDKGGG